MSKRWIAEGTLLGIAFLWGITFVLVQNAITVLPPFSFLAVRFGLAFLLLLPFAFTSRNRSKESALRAGYLGLLLGVWLYLGYALQTWSLLYTTSGKSGFLTGLSVTLVPVLSFFILRITPKPTAVAGILCSVLGLYLLAFVDFSAINIGDVLAFLCAIAFALQIVYTGKYAPDGDASMIVTAQIGTVAFLSLLSSAIWENPAAIFRADIYLNPDVATALIVTALFCTAMAFWAQTHFQKYTTPNRVALIFAMEPVFAALGDYWFKGVTLNPTAQAGCLLIFLGMILAEIDVTWWKKIRWSSQQRSKAS
ncbi:DMT family transporter [Polycladomyces sp. WAk]|uniref:DMT family transporter n=1 Tax=Polycladomyces zharkentensis TaxID=2807616 RepID=A0ABS2WLP8_9BACL|nr:DMT family transporter [Polycladomyces sp. WAk]MBN2910215.1 DMT family transporter [Polycladomyces sp. WAk]